MSVVLEGVVGSRAYGLATEDSDEDRLGVYLASAILFLGLHAPQDKNASRVSKDPDVTHHEIRKFLRLCLACNPTVMELLWLEPSGYTIRTRIGDDLIALRQSVLSRQRVEDAYFGYARQQFDRLENRSRFPDVPVARIEKHARHLKRLLRQGVDLWHTGTLTLRLEDPESYHEFGRRVADGDLEIARRELDRAQALFAGARGSGLPEYPDVLGVNAWLTRTRRNELFRAGGES